MDGGFENYCLFLKGKTDAIDGIVEEYRAGLQLYLFSVLGDNDAAEDITQDTFLKLFVGKPRFDPKASFKTWLYTIGRNQAFTYLKKQKKTVCMPDEDVSGISDDVTYLEEQYIADEMKISVHRALNKLKAEYREILWLTYFEGLSNRQSAKVMNKSVHGIETLVSRARKAMKKQLEEDGFDYEIQ